MSDKRPEPYCQTSSSGTTEDVVWEFGHANGDALHLYFRAWKKKESESESWGNEHLRGELLLNIRVNWDEADNMARGFHSAQAALGYEINKISDKQIKALKQGG